MKWLWRLCVGLSNNEWHLKSNLLLVPHIDIFKLIRRISIDFDYIRKLVRQHSAVVLDADKEYLADLHLAPLAITAGFDSIADLISHLQTQPFGTMHIQTIEALITNETSFFRDTYPFEALKNFILPEMIQRQQGTPTLNIWCAACSHGQEPYSIAMLIREHFKSLATGNVKLIASDVSTKVLTRAHQGIYNNFEIRRGLSKSLRDKYFQSQGNHWLLNQEIRQMVEFRHLNLLESWSELPAMDLIFMRNVLLYFDTETKKVILSKVPQLLKSDGYLFMGGGETTINLVNSFGRVQFGKAICYQPQK